MLPEKRPGDDLQMEPPEKRRKVSNDSDTMHFSPVANFLILIRDVDAFPLNIHAPDIDLSQDFDTTVDQALEEESECSQFEILLTQVTDLESKLHKVSSDVNNVITRLSTFFGEIPRLAQRWDSSWHNQLEEISLQCSSSCSESIIGRQFRL